MNQEAIKRIAQDLKAKKHIIDGPVTDAYWESHPRVLWVLKEANADRCDWSLCDFLANTAGALDKYPDWKRTYWKVAQVSWGLLHALPPYATVENLPELDFREALKQIAVININKGLGDTTVSQGVLAERSALFQQIVREQIAALDPQIIIGGNSLHLLAKDIELGQPWSRTPSLDTFEVGERLYLNGYHPSYWSRSRENYYEELLAVCQDWLSRRHPELALGAPPRAFVPNEPFKDKTPAKDKPVQRISSGSSFEETIGFSRALRCGNHIFVSGTAPIGDDGKTVGVGNLFLQTQRCIEVAKRALEQAGASLEDVVRTRVMLSSMTGWEEAARAHREAFGKARPTSTFVQVAGFIQSDWQVEIEVEAIVA